MPQSGRGQGWALFTPAWVGVLLLVVVVLLSIQVARGPAGSASYRAPRRLPPPSSLVPRRPGAYRESLVGRRILVDPGHGGSDPGAVGLSPVPEKTIVLDTALWLASALERAGATVVLTRRDDGDPWAEPQEPALRVRAARRWEVHVLVSLHADSSPDGTAQGVTTYYYHPEDRVLALGIQEELVPTLGAVDRGVRRADFYVLRASPVPAALVELGFVSHPSEARRLASEGYRRRAAEAIAEGLARYFASIRPR